MQIDLPMDSVTCRLGEDALIVLFEEPVKVLSSAVLNGGLCETKAIANIHVSRDFCDPDPQSFLEKAFQDLRLPDDTVGLITAVDTRNSAIISEKDGKLKVSALVTAGLSWPVAAGDKNIPDLSSSSPGTINIILIVDGNLTEGCMANCILTATEAKAVALRRLDIRSHLSNVVATGTTTDAIAVACSGRGEEIHYAGSATELGLMISEVVTRAVEEAVEKEEKLTGGRPLTKRLEERGITFETLIETGLELFIPSPEIGSREVATDLLREGLTRNLSDINVASLILAALRLEEDGEIGLIPGITKEEFLKDTTALLADESIGIAISSYISGTRGVYNFLYYDRMKPGLLKKLGPFLDDAIGGLIAGTLSLIHSSTTESVNKGR